VTAGVCSRGVPEGSSLIKGWGEGSLSPLCELAASGCSVLLGSRICEVVGSSCVCSCRAEDKFCIGASTGAGDVLARSDCRRLSSSGELEP
jgi:hypothetical protein